MTREQVYILVECYALLVSAHAKLEARITLRYVSARHKHTNIINTILIIEVSFFQGVCVCVCVCVCVREREREREKKGETLGT